MVGVLEQADQDIQGGRAVRNQLAVDVLGENEVEQKLEEGSQWLVDWCGLEFVSHHVASEHLCLYYVQCGQNYRITHLNEITAESVDSVYSDVGKSELKTGHEVLLKG